MQKFKFDESLMKDFFKDRQLKKERALAAAPFFLFEFGSP